MKKEISSVDFSSIKQNLINFLKTQTKFSGYNFEGSSLNILMDILAYNTYYQMFYNNMVFSEMFLDSATKRSSVVSIAKMLGYRPRSAKSATCVVETTCLPANLPITGLVPKYTKYKASIEGKEVTFTLLDNISLIPSEFTTTGSIVRYSTGPVEIKQGENQELSFIYDSANPFQKFVLNFDNIDVSTLEVKVQQSEYDTTGSDDIWEEATDITQITGESNSFFLEENTDGYYQLYFGDGVLGKLLTDGNKITVNFLITDPTVSNGIGEVNSTTTFTVTNNIDGNLNLACKVLIPSYGGEVKETKNSIKLNATKSFTSQERAVTLNDYKNIITKDFPNIKSVAVWGGEENNPPRYGYVYISLKPVNDTFLSIEEKQTIENYLIGNRCVAGITPKIIDPEVLYLLLDFNIILESKYIKTSITNIQDRIRRSVLSFNENTLGIFDSDFYSNELINEVDSSDKSITSIDLKLKIEKRLQPDFSNVIEYIIDFKNELNHTEDCTVNCIISTAFYYYDSTTSSYLLCQLEDDGLGNIIVVYTNEKSEKRTVATVGTVDYTTGYIKLTSFKPYSLVDDNLLSVYALPKYMYIYCTKNDFILIDNSDANSILITTSTR